MNGFNYYRIKTVWTGQDDMGGLTKVKTEELVYASSYTDAEKVAYAIIEQENRRQYSEEVQLEIIKTKIEDVLFNDNLRKDDRLTNGLVSCFFEESDDTGVGLYGVKVMFITIDEKTAKEKRKHSTIYVPAGSNSDASAIVSDYLRQSPGMGDFVIRDAKFDPTAAIYWPQEIYSSKSSISA